MRISVIGLGKLGFPLAAVLAAKGFQVVGVDVNADVVDTVNAGGMPVEEPRLKETVDQAAGRLRATSDAAEAVAGTDVSFIIVPTPSEADGGFSLKYVLEACDGITEGLRAKEGFHVVVVTSTVMPSDTGGRILRHLEARSGKVCGRDFGLCYNPEFIALGNVINDLLRPDFVLIGESDRRSGDILCAIHEKVCDAAPPAARMNFVNAELAKLSVNTFVTTRISYANTLARICERLPGADVDAVTGAIGLDSRIGSKFLKGSVAYGGPCFPRDNIAFGKLARDLGAPSLIAEATDAVNRMQLEHLAAVVIDRLPMNGTVGVLGLSYKSNTPVIEASASIELVQRLLAAGVKVIAHDPSAIPGARAVFRDRVEFADTVSDCAGRADVLVIATPWKEYASLTRADLKPGVRSTVIDCWRILPRETFVDACNYVVIGAGGDEPENAIGESGTAMG